MVDFTVVAVLSTDSADTDVTLEFNSGNMRRAAITGDVTIAAGSNTSAIGSGVVVNADINASAAIATSKLADGATIALLVDAAETVAFRTLTEDLILDADADTDTAIEIPAHTLVVAVTGVTVSEASDGPPATYDIGVAGATSRYGNDIAATTGVSWPGTIDGIRYYSAATKIRVTPDTPPGSDDGVVRIVIAFIEVTPPTA